MRWHWDFLHCWSLRHGNVGIVKHDQSSGVTTSISCHHESSMRSENYLWGQWRPLQYYSQSLYATPVHGHYHVAQKKRYPHKMYCMPMVWSLFQVNLRCIFKALAVNLQTCRMPMTINSSRDCLHVTESTMQSLLAIFLVVTATPYLNPYEILSCFMGAWLFDVSISFSSGSCWEATHAPICEYVLPWVFTRYFTSRPNSQLDWMLKIMATEKV